MTLRYADNSCGSCFLICGLLASPSVCNRLGAHWKVGSQCDGIVDIQPTKFRTTHEFKETCPSDQEVDDMNRTYGDSQYMSILVKDDKDGSTAVELHRTSSGKTVRIASVVFWDACGQFFVETFNSDVPLEILEELMAEAKEKIKTR